MPRTASDQLRLSALLQREGDSGESCLSLNEHQFQLLLEILQNDNLTTLIIYALGTSQIPGSAPNTLCAIISVHLALTMVP